MKLTKKNLEALQPFQIKVEKAIEELKKVKEDYFRKKSFLLLSQLSKAKKAQLLKTLQKDLESFKP